MQDDELQDDQEENAGALLDDSIFEEPDLDILDEVIDPLELEDKLVEEDPLLEEEEILDELDILALEEEEEDLDFFNDEDDY